MSETQAAQKTEKSPEDALKKLIHVEIPRELMRIQRMKDPSVANLHAELHGTIGSLVGALGSYLLEIRNWSSELHSIQADHIEALDARVDTIEEFGGDTQLLPNDAELLAKVVVACEYLASEMIKGAVPERDEDGKEKLAEIIVLCSQAKKLIDDNTLSFDDDEPSEEDEAEESPASDEPN